MKKSVLVISLALALVLVGLSTSCVSQDLYQKVASDLVGAQAQIQLLQGDLSSKQNELKQSQTECLSTQKALDTAQSQIQSAQKSLDSSQSQNKSLQKSLDDTQSQIKTLKSDLSLAQNDLKQAQTKAQLLKKASAYAEFLDLLFWAGWKAAKLPSQYSFATVEEYGLALIQSASRIGDDKVDNYLKQVTTDYMNNPSLADVRVVELIQYCLE